MHLLIFTYIYLPRYVRIDNKVELEHRAITYVYPIKNRERRQLKLAIVHFAVLPMRKLR